jgi:hypothetical protein
MITTILDYIAAGSINLSAMSVLVPQLTEENAQALLEKAKDLSKRDVEFLVAGLSPKQEPRDLIIAMPPPPAEAGGRSPEFAPAFSGGGVTAAPPPPRPEGVNPLTEKSARIYFTATKDLLDKLERARGLLRHKFPRGRFGEVMNEALEALLDRIDRGRKARPAPERPVLPGRRRIPEWVKDAVYLRDGGRCAFESVDGARCADAEWLEFDHFQPFALGGVSDDPDNVRLLCRAHNQHRARETFGEGEWSGGTFVAEGEDAAGGGPGG